MVGYGQQSSCGNIRMESSMVQKHEICKADHSYYDNGTESLNQIINYAYNGGMVVNMWHRV